MAGLPSPGQPKFRVPGCLYFIKSIRLAVSSLYREVFSPLCILLFCHSLSQ